MPPRVNVWLLGVWGASGSVADSADAPAPNLHCTPGPPGSANHLSSLSPRPNPPVSHPLTTTSTAATLQHRLRGKTDVHGEEEQTAHRKCSEDLRGTPVPLPHGQS